MPDTNQIQSNKREAYLISPVRIFRAKRDPVLPAGVNDRSNKVESQVEQRRLQFALDKPYSRAPAPTQFSQNAIPSADTDAIPYTYRAVAPRNIAG